MKITHRCLSLPRLLIAALSALAGTALLRAQPPPLILHHGLSSEASSLPTAICDNWNYIKNQPFDGLVIKLPIAESRRFSVAEPRTYRLSTTLQF